MSDRTDVDSLNRTQSPETPDDSPLVAMVRQGDGSACDVLVRRYQRRAVAVAYRILGNIEDASDVAQDAFIRAFDRIEQLSDDARFGPWMLRIVSNLALNARRSRRTAVPLEGSEDVAAPADRSRERADDELRLVVNRTIQKLPEKQRMALILFSVEGFPQRDVAEMLDCSVELVKWNVFQARKAVKEALARYSGDA